MQPGSDVAAAPEHAPHTPDGARNRGHRVAIASCDRLMPDGDSDDQLLVAALAELGVDAVVRSWTDPDLSWDGFDLTVIRSTWDYTDDRERFLRWLRNTPRLHNPAEVIAANSDKTYLRDLDRAGIPTVPTIFAAPGEAIPLPEVGEFVVKPSVGAGSRGAGRFVSPGQLDEARAHADELHRAGRTVMVQPYLGAVDSAGETAMIFLDGQFSHAICKAAMLPPDSSHRLHADQLYVAEQITARTPSDAERQLADRVVAYYSHAPDADLAEVAGALGGGGSLLYARVDLLPAENGPVVIEVELSEPSLFLSYKASAAADLAAAIVRRIGSHEHVLDSSVGGKP